MKRGVDGVRLRSELNAVEEAVLHDSGLFQQYHEKKAMSNRNQAKNRVFSANFAKKSIFFMCKLQKIGKIAQQCDAKKRPLACGKKISAVSAFQATAESIGNASPQGMTCQFRITWNSSMLLLSWKDPRLFPRRIVRPSRARLGDGLACRLTRGSSRAASSARPAQAQKKLRRRKVFSGAGVATANVTPSTRRRCRCVP